MFRASYRHIKTCFWWGSSKFFLFLSTNLSHFSDIGNFVGRFCRYFFLTKQLCLKHPMIKFSLFSFCLSIYQMTFTGQTSQLVIAMLNLVQLTFRFKISISNFFYHIFPTSELLLQASWCGELPPGLGAQNWPFEPLCQETMMRYLCKFFGW